MRNSGLQSVDECTWYACKLVCHQRLSFGTYNCQALPAHRPLRMVLAKLLFDIIAPQSTCETWGWIQQQSEQMFYRRNIGPSHVFSWPRASNTQMSKVTGVLLAFNRRKVPTKSIAQVYTPDRDIVGRAGAVRIRNRSGIDLCVGSLYLPPTSTPLAKDIAARIWSWAQQLLLTLPQRCIPLFLLDANARFGKCPSWSVDGLPLIGTSGPDKENQAGRVVRKFVEDTGLTFLNTFGSKSSQPTWYHTRGKDEILKTFRLSDDGETGKISFKNLRRVAKELGEGMIDEELQEMIDDADRDGDGEVNEEDFSSKGDS